GVLDTLALTQEAVFSLPCEHAEKGTAVASLLSEFQQQIKQQAEQQQLIPANKLRELLDLSCQANRIVSEIAADDPRGGDALFWQEALHHQLQCYEEANQPNSVAT